MQYQLVKKEAVNLKENREGTVWGRKWKGEMQLNYNLKKNA